MAARRLQITCPAARNCRVARELSQVQSLASKAGDTEEADARRDQETSTWLSEQVAVNLTRSATSGARNSRVGNAKFETFEDAGEIVRMPAMTQYHGDGDCSGVLIGPKVAWGSPEQLLEVIIDVQLFKDRLD
jgi:hypothetical protein